MTTHVRYTDTEDLQDIREYVSETLCEQYQLQSCAFRMTERVLIRGGKPCGVYFCLHGPRMTKFSAIWDQQRNQILFYGCDGERFQRTQLVESRRLACAAA